MLFSRRKIALFGKSVLRNRSVYVRMLISYCLVLILPFVLSITIYSLSRRIIRERFITNNQVLQQQLGELIENNIASVQALRNLLMEDANVISFMNSSGQTPIERYNLLKMRNQFKTLHLLNPTVENFYVYFDNSGKYLNMLSFYDANTMYTYAHPESDLTFEKWEELHEHWQDDAIYYLRQSNDEMQILTVNSLPHYHIYRPRATLYIVTTPVKLFGTLDKLPFEDGTFFAVLNEANEVLLSNAEIDFSQISAAALETFDATFDQVIEESKYLVTYRRLNEYGWKTVILLSERAIEESARNIRTIAFFATFVCMLLDLFLANAFTNWHYKPLRSIVDTVSGGNWEGGNEYQEIQRQFESLSQNKNELTKTLDIYQNKLRDEFLSSFFRGKLMGNFPEPGVLYQDYGIRCEREYFYLVMLYADTLPKVQSDENCCVYCLNVKGVCVMLVNTDEEVFPSYLQQTICTVTSDSIPVLCSPVFCKLAETPSVYRKMMQTMEKILTSRQTGFIKLDAFPDQTSSLLNRILECIHAHYTEADFNVSALAEILAMNNSYISNYFKEQMGVGILNYLTNLRIMRAKELLRDRPEQPLSEIIVQVGFGNVNSFIRTFKNYEGITPTEYRNV